MTDSPIDRKQCGHCRGEIPKISAHCPLCGEKQKFETEHTPIEEPESESVPNVSVTTSNGSELSWSEVKDTKAVWRLELVYNLLGLSVYLGTAGVILIGFHGIYRIAIGSSMFLTSILWMVLIFILVMAFAGANELFRRLSPTYRLVTNIEE